MRIRVLIAGALVAAGAVLVTPSMAVAQEPPEEEHSTDISHAAEECIHILEAGGEPDRCQEAPNVILPAREELIWGSISFFLLLLLMWRFALPPIRSMMEARAQRIRESLDEAERAKSEAERILEDYQRQLADARNESARIIEEARQTAEQLRRDLMARAESEVQELRQRSAEDINAAKERAFAELHDRLTALAVSAAEIVVQKNLDPETQRALVERYIEQVGAGT